MKLNEFVEEYNKLETNEEKNAFTKERIIIDYIPYVGKAEQCLRIINSTWYVKDDKTEKRKLHITSTGTYVLYTMNLINLYTDLEVDFKDVMHEYDVLNKGNLLGVLLQCISENELKEFRAILDMTESDVMQNEYYIGSYIANRIEDISLSIGATAIPAVEQLGKLIQGLDEEKVNEFVNTLENNKILKKFME